MVQRATWSHLEPPEMIHFRNPWNDTKISILPTLSCRATGGEHPERTGMFCWKGSQPQPSLPKGGAGASLEQQLASSTQLHTASFHSAAEEKDFILNVPWNQQRTWTRMLGFIMLYPAQHLGMGFQLRWHQACTPKHFQVFWEKKKIKITALGKTHVLHIALGSCISGYKQNFGRITLLTWWLLW